MVIGYKWFYWNLAPINTVHVCMLSISTWWVLIQWVHLLSNAYASKPKY
jgi:hypothetical protein